MISAKELSELLFYTNAHGFYENAIYDTSNINIRLSYFPSQKKENLRIETYDKIDMIYNNIWLTVKNYTQLKTIIESIENNYV